MIALPDGVMVGATGFEPVSLSSILGRAILGAIWLSLAPGCSTTLYHPNGKPKFRTYGDSTAIAYQDKTTTLQVSGLDHSTPTRATGSVIGTGMTGAAALGIGGVR